MGIVFAQYPPGRWRVGSLDPIVFPVLSVTEQGGNRIVTHERPGRNGAKLDDTGSKARQWQVAMIFANTIEEPGIEDNPQPLYPFMLRRMIDSFDVHETGTLVCPTVGEIRARVVDYTRREMPEEDDAAILDVVFLQDNEDALDRSILEPPSVTATVRKLAEQTTFSAQKSGVWSDGIASLRTAASEIETLMREPIAGSSKAW
jgi:prophage DNA circulation protein